MTDSIRLPDMHKSDDTYFKHHLFFFGGRPFHPLHRHPFDRFEVHDVDDEEAPTLSRFLSRFLSGFGILFPTPSGTGRIGSPFEQIASLPGGQRATWTVILSAPLQRSSGRPRSLGSAISELRRVAGAHAFLVLWHPDAVEDAALRIEAFASGANMVRGRGDEGISTPLM